MTAHSDISDCFTPDPPARTSEERERDIRDGLEQLARVAPLPPKPAVPRLTTAQAKRIIRAEVIDNGDDPGYYDNIRIVRQGPESEGGTLIHYRDQASQRQGTIHFPYDVLDPDYADDLAPGALPAS